MTNALKIVLACTALMTGGVVAGWPVGASAAACSDSDKRQMRKEGLTKSSIERICSSTREDDDDDDDTPPRGRNTGQGRPPQPPPRLSNRCMTQVTACFLPGMGPVGTPCWCATPFGPANGMVQ